MGLKSLLLRPSLWTALLAVLVYWDDAALHGKFVYDDQGSVKRNVVVSGVKPLKEVLSRDYWGTEMSEPQSHKSFRPITTLTFRLNWVLSERKQPKGQPTNPDDPDFTYGFHLVNVLLHGLVTGLVTEAASFVFWETAAADSIWKTLCPLITGLVFGLHPVHAETVSNITSRGELLMSVFFLVAFLSYASALESHSGFKYFISIYVVPWICMCLSLFSKEQGATTLITLVLYDFLQHHESLLHYKDQILGNASSEQTKRAWAFFRRTFVLAIQTLLLVALRYWLNGETSPDFIYDQNPAGFSEDRFTRIFSVNWVYCLYILDAVFPKYLAPDWSGLSIDVINDVSDGRIFGVLALWTFAGACLVSLVTGPPKSISQSDKDARKVVLMAFFAFAFSPFLLSSNLLVVVGLMKADRVIYLPLLGFCLLEAQLIKTVSQKDKDSYWIAYVLVLLQLGLFCGKTHERNLAWSDSLRLWETAYAVNSKSHHTLYNYGYELSLARRFEEAEQVLRPIRDPRVDSPSNTFVYCMVVYNLRRCDDVNYYADLAMDVLDEKEKAGGVRDTKESIARVRSNLMVAKAHCIESIPDRGKMLYDAVQVDLTNEYAHNQAKALVEQVEMMNQRMQYKA